MAKKQVSTAAPAPANRPPYMLIEEIRVQGYKSLVDATLHVRPLTLLAGTNSSGKSSIMQPLLLIKQTMEAPYQPAGALLLSGPHVQAETAGELVSKVASVKEPWFSLLIEGINKFPSTSPAYNHNIPCSIELAYNINEENFDFKYQRSDYNKLGQVEINPKTWKSTRKEHILSDKKRIGIVQRNNGFLKIDFFDTKGNNTGGSIVNTFVLEHTIPTIIHIPGLRRAPQRSYLATLFQNQVKGTFDLYAAGTVSQWQEQQDTEKLAKLNDYLRRLGLTDSVTAKVKNANEVELSVSRLPAGSKGKPRKADMVNIADVGIGVSQVLPILVALIAAQEGQLVYVEQPELHLHPRAQVAMAELLAEAANRGVRVIVETHSSLLLLTVQTLIAQNRIKNTDVALHWFARDAKGATQVTYVEPDEDGAYGEWPEDFGDVELKAQDAYLTAVGLRHFGNAAN